MPKKPAYLESRVISFSGLKCSSGARIPALSAPMLGLLCLTFLRLVSSAEMVSGLGSFVCNSTAISGYLPVGTGLCADAAGRRTSGHYCWGPACPDFTPSSCASACDGTPGCTGFVLQNCSGQQRSPTNCVIVSPAAPPAAAVPNTTLVWTYANSTQPPGGSGLAVSRGDGAVTSSCCYKRSYPKPTPIDNPLPQPPAQTPAQQSEWANRSAAAHAASMAALPQLEAIVNACAPLLYTQSTCPGLNLGPNETATASAVLARFEEEVAAAEYVHGFAPNLAINSIEYLFAPTIPFQLNLYTPCSLGIGLPSSTYVDCHVQHKGPNPGMDKMMQLFFGSRPFSKWPPPFLEANDRVVYTAINFNRAPASNYLGFGNFDVILRPSSVRDRILFTPSDSYHYVPQYPNCQDWPGCAVGTIDDNYHILLAWMRAHGATAPPSCKAPAVGFLTDMVCPTYPSASAPLIPDIYSYWEADVLGTVRYPQDIKAVVANFETHFGASSGAALQKWCAQWGWPLLWSTYSTKACHDPRRAIDLMVAATSHVNISTPPALTAAFSSLWARAAAERANASKAPIVPAAWWSDLVKSPVPGVNDTLLFAIGARDCTDADRCLGQTVAGVCVCRTS